MTFRLQSLLSSSISLIKRSSLFSKSAFPAIAPISSSSKFHCCRHFSKMPPVPLKSEEVLASIDEIVKNNTVAIFSKSWCPFCKKVKGLFTELQVPFHALELDQFPKEDEALYQEMLKKRTGMSSVPNVFVNGSHVGGCDDTHKMHNQNKLIPLIQQSSNGTAATSEGDLQNYDYDLIVIGGGSGGLAASKEAAKLGMKVAVCDFVKPTPIGTAWGLGGTCVNVGCIPKKLMHQAALLGQYVSDASHFGWEFAEERNHNWEKLREAIQNYIGSLNWGYRVSLKEAKVNYLNEFAEFVDAHTLQTTNKKNKTQNVTARNFLVAVGGRPRYPDIPGAREFGITSDDIFSLSYNPGKTVCIGASYIALECAGFLSGLGLETTVVARSILLRGFDQQIADMIGDHMEGHGVKFYRGWVPVSVQKLEDGAPPKLLVTIKNDEGDTVDLEVNTVLFAIGRDPCTSDLKLENAGVNTSLRTGKILADDADRTNVPHIYAIGDVAEGRPELTPVAIQAGILLSRRLNGQKTLTDYDKVPTTVFTPLEYGCIGLSEEEAINRYDAENIEIYHTNFQSLETAIPKRDENKCYAKLVCLKTENERVIGFHYLGPNAGEITQGFALGIKLGATKSDFDSLIGIHPTSAENFTTLDITKSSGVNAMKKGC